MHWFIIVLFFKHRSGFSCFPSMTVFLDWIDLRNCLISLPICVELQAKHCPVNIPKPPSACYITAIWSTDGWCFGGRKELPACLKERRMSFRNFIGFRKGKQILARFCPVTSVTRVWLWCIAKKSTTSKLVQERKNELHKREVVKTRIRPNITRPR